MIAATVASNAWPRSRRQPAVGLGALLATNILFGGKGQTASAGSQPAGAGSQPATDTSDAGGVLGGLGGLLNKLEQGGLGDQTKSWVGSGQIQPVSPGQLGSALGPSILKTVSQLTGISEDDLTKQLSQVLPGVVNGLTHPVNLVRRLAPVS